MITFTKDEIIASSKVSRNFGSLLKKLKDHQLEKIAVIKNNEMEAIILSYDEYERINDLFEYIEYKSIYDNLKKRKKTYQTEYRDFDSVLKKMDLTPNDL